MESPKLHADGETWECHHEKRDVDWWCWRRAEFIGQVGNEQYWACGTCPGIFRTGAA